MSLMDPIKTFIILISFLAIILFAKLFRNKILTKLPLIIRKKIYILTIVFMLVFIVIACYVVFLKEDSDAENAFYEQWQVQMMDYDKLHKKSLGTSQTIAIIDSGISKFQDSLVVSNTNYSKENYIYDTNGHGTMMCSLIKGNGDKFLGIAPDVQVRIYKIVDEEGKIEPQILEKAINDAINDNVSIINISLGSYILSDEIETRINEAYEKGIIIVASSGDYESSDMLYPAKMKNVLSVGAIDKQGKPWEGTNSAKECDILAPGESILTVESSDNIIDSSGTSQATAIISGYVALLLDYAKSSDKELVFDDIKYILNSINNGQITYEEGFELVDKI